MRLFFGLPLGPAARAAVSELLKEWNAAPSGKNLRWVRPDLIHITLRFLGEVPDAAFLNLKGWESAVAGISPIPVTYGPLDAFPGVLFFKVSPVEPLQELYRRLEEFLRNIGFPDEDRNYIPHLTVARSKHRGTPPNTYFTQPAHIQDVLREIVLFKSHLTPSGPIYTPLSIARFG